MQANVRNCGELQGNVGNFRHLRVNAVKCGNLRFCVVVSLTREQKITAREGIDHGTQIKKRMQNKKVVPEFKNGKCTRYKKGF
jgi:hypothetical protein